MEIKKKIFKKEKQEAKENKLDVYNASGDKVARADSIFDGRVNKRVLAQGVRIYLANMRKGLAGTKTRGEVSGGGKKPWKQKGTGRARAGSTRSPLWRHGGVVFGPHPKDFRYQLPAGVRNSALSSALNEKSAAAAVVVIDELTLAAPKSKEAQKLLDKLGVNGKALFVLEKQDKNVQRACRNIKGIMLKEAHMINALDVMRASKIIVVKGALGILEKRIR